MGRVCGFFVGKGGAVDRHTLTFVVNAALTEAVWDGVRLFRQRFSKEFRFHVFATQEVDENGGVARRLEESLRGSHMVFLDLRGGGRAAAVCARVLPAMSQPVVLLLGGSPDTLRLLRLGSFSLDKALNRSSSKRKSRPMQPSICGGSKRGCSGRSGSGRCFLSVLLKHAGNWVRMMRYWQEGGAENIALLIAFAAKEYLGQRHFSVAGPVVFPDFGLCEQSLQLPTSTGHCSRPGAQGTNGAPCVGVLLYGGMHFSQSLVPAQALAEALGRKGFRVCPVFANWA